MGGFAGLLNQGTGKSGVANKGGQFWDVRENIASEGPLPLIFLSLEGRGLR
jgi:hypothetical protein